MGMTLKTLRERCSSLKDLNRTTPSLCLHAVQRHWWITAKNIGLVDFSPDLSVAHADWDACDFDYIFANKVVTRENWSFEHTDRFETVKAKLASVQQHTGKNACIYFRE